MYLVDNTDALVVVDEAYMDFPINPSLSMRRTGITLLYSELVLKPLDVQVYAWDLPFHRQISPGCSALYARHII